MDEACKSKILLLEYICLLTRTKVRVFWSYKLYNKQAQEGLQPWYLLNGNHGLSSTMYYSIFHRWRLYNSSRFLRNVNCLCMQINYFSINVYWETSPPVAQYQMAERMMKLQIWTFTIKEAQSLSSIHYQKVAQPER